MFARKHKTIDPKNTGYCKTGLGAGSPECFFNVQKTEYRIASGGPGIAAEMLKGAIPAEPGLTLLLPDAVNSLEKLSKYLIESGYQRNTPEYMELYSKYRAGLRSESPYL